MKLTSNSFINGQAIPGELAFCIADRAHHVCLGKNLNPQLGWYDVPAATQSFALICHDPDVPSRGDDVNREDRSVPATLPRIDFFHWVLIDLPATLCAKSRPGEFSKEVTPRGKTGPGLQRTARARGLNDYTGMVRRRQRHARRLLTASMGPARHGTTTIVHHYVLTVLRARRRRQVGRSDGKVHRSGTCARRWRGHILDEAKPDGALFAQSGGHTLSARTSSTRKINARSEHAAPQIPASDLKGDFRALRA